MFIRWKEHAGEIEPTTAQQILRTDPTVYDQYLKTRLPAVLRVNLCFLPARVRQATDAVRQRLLEAYPQFAGAVTQLAGNG
jgi:hypothetical protein